MNVTLIDNLAALDALADEWPALSGGMPFRSLEWLGTWWRCFGDKNPAARLLTLSVRDAEGSLVAVAPWYLSRSLGGGRVIRFLGSGVVCSEYLTVNCRPSLEKEVAAALARWLANEHDCWDLIELTSVDADDRIVPELGLRLSALGHRLHDSRGPNCWRLSLPNKWDDYVATLPRAQRQRVRVLTRRMFETGRAVVRVVDDPQHWPEAFETFRHLHEARRHSLGQRGCFSTPEFARFLDEAGQKLVGAGRAFLALLEIDGQPAGAEYNLVGDDAIYYYQTGMDPAHLAAQPGHILAIARIRRAIDKGLKVIDFLRGDEPYKAHWKAEPRPLCELRIVHRRATAELRHRLWIVGRGARRVARRGLNMADDVKRRVNARRVAVLHAWRPAENCEKTSATHEPVTTVE